MPAAESRSLVVVSEPWTDNLQHRSHFGSSRETRQGLTRRNRLSLAISPSALPTRPDRSQQKGQMSLPEVGLHGPLPCQTARKKKGVSSVRKDSCRNKYLNTMRSCPRPQRPRDSGFKTPASRLPLHLACHPLWAVSLSLSRQSIMAASGRVPPQH